MKGYLQEQGTRFPKIHDLGTTSRLDQNLGLALADHTAELSTLTTYEAATRYPPVLRVTPEQAREAVGAAEEIRGIILPLLDLEP